MVEVLARDDVEPKPAEHLCHRARVEHRVVSRATLSAALPITSTTPFWLLSPWTTRSVPYPELPRHRGDSSGGAKDVPAFHAMCHVKLSIGRDIEDRDSTDSVILQHELGDLL